ncbi:hypothetical protein [Nonomuraea sp. NPDC005650]
MESTPVQRAFAKVKLLVAAYGALSVVVLAAAAFVVNGSGLRAAFPKAR